MERPCCPSAAANSSEGSSTHERAGEGAAARRAADASTLGARYHSLLERRARMRSALYVLDVSEKARAALESRDAPARRAVRVEEAMKVWTGAGGNRAGCKGVYVQLCVFFCLFASQSFRQGRVFGMMVVRLVVVARYFSLSRAVVATISEQHFVSFSWRYHVDDSGSCA